MFVLLLIVALILFGFGFLNPLWWLAAAVLVLQRHPLRPRSRGEAGSVATVPIPGSTGIAGTVGIARSAGIVATAVGTGRDRGARTVGTATTRMTDEVA
ncbi:hypothetical protein [Streptomyces xylophagus]|uniref:hypothetical protein n=1 Tax=Streptomyces xylophagus TaxID=285514 RepID=UPI000AAEA971|nr:hypothetical protein [Streptomyces xylophagus]